MLEESEKAKFLLPLSLQGWCFNIWNRRCGERDNKGNNTLGQWSFRCHRVHRHSRQAYLSQH